MHREKKVQWQWWHRYYLIQQILEMAELKRGSGPRGGNLAR